MNNKALAKGLAKVSVAVLVLSLVSVMAVKVILPAFAVTGDAKSIAFLVTDSANTPVQNVKVEMFVSDSVNGSYVSESSALTGADGSAVISTSSLDKYVYFAVSKFDYSSYWPDETSGQYAENADKYVILVSDIASSSESPISIKMDVIPAIWTDKSDYRPGETVYIYGASFDVPSVHLNTAAGSSVIDERDVAVADGKFETILTLGSSPETATIIASYNSQVLAATSFTDSPTQTCVNLPAIDDAAVQHAHSTRNYGQNTILHTKYDDGSDVRRSYLKFDLSSIPAGSTINSATLSLFKQTGDNSRTVYLYLVATDTWVEGTCTDSHDSCGGGIKWENMPAYSTPCGSISVGSSYTYYPGVVTSCVQGEFSGDKKISLSAKVDETGSADRHEDFYSEEQSGTSQDPKLEVCYQAAPTQSCGNGIKEGTEACDGGACCNTDCTFKSSATECRASAGACDPAETCTGSSATCPTDDKAPVGTSCSNGLYCDGAETCDGAGSCAVGTSVTCNDGLSCTSDICNDNSDMCVFTPNDAACDDQNVCTTDVCSIIGGCSHPYNTASCDDSNQCTTSDVCALGVCAGTPKNCDDGNACTTDSCNPANGDCVHIISDQTGPFTSIPTVQPSFNNGVFNLNTNATDTCSNIQISKYYIGRSNESLGYCDDFSSSQFYVTGAMEPVDGSYNSTFEKVFKNNIAFFLDGVNFACVKSWDVNGNPGSCACAYFETDTLPPDCAYNIYLNGYFTPSNQLICQNSFTINATVCDKQSNIQGGEYFLDTQIPPVPTPGSGIWMTNLTRFARPTDGSLCAVIGASVDASHLQDGLHTINLRGKDAFNWGKIENCQEVSFIVDTTAPSTSKTLTPYQGSQHECTESDITGANLPVGVSLTNGCAFVKAGTTVTLHPSDQNPNSQVHWIVKYKVNPGDSWVDDQQGVGTPGQDVTITFSKDSYHLIEYWSVDACGNAEAHKYELDIVDTVAPSTEKTMTGTQIAGEGFTWITQGTTITLSCVDPAPHPSDHVTLYAKYNVDGGVNWIDIPTSNGYAQFHFNEDSVHTLQYYCVDALGNTEATQTEVDKVDTTAPVTTKTYGTPLVTTNGDYPKWITSATQVTLSSVDGGAICAIGQDKTYYKVTALADNIKCANQALCTPIHGYDAVWTQYTSGSPFTVAESSCHMIEYYSVDALGNKEPIRAQCVYVDNTSPASQKVVGDPKVPAECSSLGQGSFTDGCYYVTKATQVSLSCSDQGDHPVDNVAIHYKVDWKNQASDSWTEGSWAAGSSSVSFTYQEDSYHRLSWYCADALGNIEQTRTELDMVDTQAPVSTKDLGTPKHACNDTEQSTYYPGMAAPTAGCNFITKQTSITINCADQIPHPVGGETIKYKYYLLGSEPEAWTTVAGTQATVTNSEDSAHVLKWQCVDALGNTETVHTEYDIVDTQAPTFEKSLIGPYSGACLPQNENDVCFVDGVTKIHVVSTDEGPHPSDHVTCDWDYTVVGGTKIGTGQTGVTPPFDINFPEESEHTLTVTCKDVLGNSVTDVEKFVVDKTAPTTTNTYGTPLVTTAGGYPKWITSQTAVTLAVDDTGVHKSGIKETKYRVTLLGSDAPCQNDELCQQQTGSGEFSAYSNAFTIGQESCHLIEFYSVDNVQKTETTKKQCVFVENTAPQSSKSLTGQQHACGTGENLGIADCSYITQATDVTLTCSDNGNHPVDQVKIEYKVDWKQDSGDTWTEGILQEAGSQVTFKYTKDSYHKLTWYCVDALNNAEAQHVELDIVDTQAPVSQKILGTPQHACNATEQSAYYPEMASPTAGCNFITKQTSITINCADQIPHPVGGETIKYKYYLLGSEPEAWTTVAGTQATVTNSEDSAHVLKWQCVDALGNTETVHTEYDIVDTAAPVVSSSIIGPSFYNGAANKTFVDTVTNISLACADQQPHPSDDVQIKYRYQVDDGAFTEWATYIAPFGFPEESKHTLQFYCADALGNQDGTHEAIYYSDHSAPVTTKTYGDPFFSNATAEWINSSTPITLAATDILDEGDVVHASGVDATYYRVSLVDDRYCTGVEGWRCSSAEGSGEFSTYADPFTISQESCHMIEYYSVDNVQKTETTSKQCVFVDNSAPVTAKTVGKPNTKWDGSDAVYYDIADKCWSENGDSIDCWKVTTMTPIYMGCVDQQPHPSGNAQTCFSVGLDGSDDTASYCDDFDGTMQENGFCCVKNSDTLGLMFKEETEHELEYYCKDALGNTGALDVEKFKVQGTSFNITLNKKWNLVSVPFVMLDGSIDAAFADIEDKVIGVWTYDGSTDTWYVYKPNGPNTIHEMVPGWGYWVLMNDSATMNIGGSLFSPAQTPPQKQLVHGWNLIGYYDTDGLLSYNGPFGYGRTSYCALQSLVDTQIGYPRWSSLLTYWQPISPTWKYLDTMDKMDPGAGYWLEIDVADTYAFSTTCGLV